MSVKELFKWYLDHQDILVQKYNGRVLVIKDNEVKGDFDSEGAAYSFAVKEQYEPGTFMIQECSPGSEAYSQTFFTRRASFV
nr:hypothetical protein [uncultured Porphyromonas sp.]